MLAFVVIFSILFPLYSTANRQQKQAQAYHNEYHLQTPYINSESVSVTSFSFNPNGYSVWVDRLFGKDAVYWGGSAHSYSKLTVEDKARNDTIAKIKAQYRENLLRIDAQHELLIPQRNHHCSIEILGHVKISKPAPFPASEQNKMIGIGLGKAVISSITETVNEYSESVKDWKCVYRSTYAAWRQTMPTSSASRPVLIYCAPPPHKTTRMTAGTAAFKLESGNGENVFSQQYMNFTSSRVPRSTLVSYKLQLYLENPALPPLVAVFNTYRDSEEIPRFMELESAGRKPIAVCTAWPYTTSDFTKMRANQAMVYEFLRYYSNLGFWLMVYDNNGVNMKGVLDSAYARANPQKGRFAGAIRKHLIYHNYTIAGLLMPQSDPHYYDNEHTNQSVEQETTYIQGDDKTSTLTHCRFEARARYGIERVLVVDFDEFLFAQDGGTDPEQQRRYMDKYFDHAASDVDMSYGPLIHDRHAIASVDERETAGNNDMNKLGLEQLLFEQAVPKLCSGAHKSSASCAIALVDEYDSMLASVDVRGHNFSSDPELSLLSATYNNVVGRSLFDCFCDSRNKAFGTNVKALHLSYVCPLTNFHHACTPVRVKHIPNFCYDCLCSGKSMKESRWVVLHLSLRKNDQRVTLAPKSEHFTGGSQRSELWSIANAM